MNEYPRDMVGYGQKRPQLTWPDGSKIAVQFVLNYEEKKLKNYLFKINLDQSKS